VIINKIYIIFTNWKMNILINIRSLLRNFLTFLFLPVLRSLITFLLQFPFLDLYFIRDIWDRASDIIENTLDCIVNTTFMIIIWMLKFTLIFSSCSWLCLFNAYKKVFPLTQIAKVVKWGYFGCKKFCMIIEILNVKKKMGFW
jgi:hypothetical protein